jgi:hypothetical protein
LIIIFVLKIAKEVTEVSNKNQRTISFIFRRIQYVLLLNFMTCYVLKSISGWN